MNSLLHIAWAVYQWTCTLMFMLFSKTFPQPAEGCNITCCNFLTFSYNSVTLKLLIVIWNQMMQFWNGSLVNHAVLCMTISGWPWTQNYYCHNVLYSSPYIQYERHKARTYSSWIWSESLWMNWDAVLKNRLVWLPHQHNIINFIPLKTCQLRCPFSRLFFCNLLMFAKNVNLH